MVDEDMVLAFADLYPQDGPITLRRKTGFAESGDTFANPDITIQKCRKLDTNNETIALLNLETNAPIVDFDLWDEGQPEAKVGDVLVHQGINWQVKRAQKMVRNAIQTVTVQADAK